MCLERVGWRPLYRASILVLDCPVQSHVIFTFPIGWSRPPSFRDRFRRLYSPSAAAPHANMVLRQQIRTYKVPEEF